jgi:hypothetical protein
MPWMGGGAGRTSGGVVLFFRGLEKKLLIADPLAVLIAPYWQGPLYRHPPRAAACLVRGWVT